MKSTDKIINDTIIKLHADNTIPTLIKRISKKHLPQEDLDELTQYVYLQLLERKEHTLELINAKKPKALTYYLCVMIKQQLFSSSSWYHYNLRKWKERNDSL